MIIVTGANGQLGRAIVEQLLHRGTAPEQIAVSVRDPDKASALAGRGVSVRRGDFDDPQGPRQAFEGASRVLIISADSTGEQTVRQHNRAIEAASAAGAQRILYTRHMGARSDSAFEPMPDHAAAEAKLAESGVAFTSLRNGFYAANALQLMSRALQTSELYAPEDGKVAWTSHADLAEAAAILLADEHRFDGMTPPLTASEAFDMTDLAAIVSELTGRRIKRIVVPDEQWRDNMVSHGAPESVADLLVGLFVAARRGDFSQVDPTLESMLGRRPQTMREILAAALSG